MPGATHLGRKPSNIFPTGATIEGGAALVVLFMIIKCTLATIARKLKKMFITHKSCRVQTTHGAHSEVGVQRKRENRRLWWLSG